MAKRMKQTVSLLLALVMVFTMLPITAAAEMNETLVNRLTSVYGGDEQRARSDLDLLYDAGIIDEDGNMVALDVREDGASADLDALAQRIAKGDSVGALTVNGTAVSAEQILQIQQIRSLLDTVRLLEQDVEITDQHVANFQKLVAGLADGTIDVDEVIRTGSLSLRAASPRALGAVSDGYETGDMALTDGTFTAPMLSGADYTADYAFSAGAATTWYTDSAHKGIVADGVVTLAVEEKESYAPGDTVTVTASLDKAQTVPVSFDWKVAGAAVGVNDTASGTVTWAAGDTADKTFSFTIGTKADTASLADATDAEKQIIYADIWQGGRALVINASNIRNAEFTGNAATWSQTIQVSAADNDAIKASYIQTNTVTGFTKTEANDARGKRCITYHKKLTGDDAWKIPQDGNCTIKVSYDGGSVSMQIGIADPDETVSPNAASGQNAKIIGNLTNKWSANKTGESPRTVNVGTLNAGIVNDKGETWIIMYFANTNGLGLKFGLTSFEIAARKPSEHDLVKSVTVPAGTYHTGEIVPVTVELDNFVKADANTKLTVNGVSCGLLDAADTETRKLTFGYTVKTTDTGAVNVTALTGLKNGDNMAVTLDAAFAAQSFGVDQDVKLVSDFKSNSIDWDNAKWGVTDTDANDQTVTVVLPLKSGADNLAWVASEAVQYNTTGTPVAMPIPGYSDATADDYVPGAYLSTDGGATRYPLFVAVSGGNPVALVARFKAPDNESDGLRKDTLNLFMDPEIVTSENATKYLPALGTAQDAVPYAATAAAAPIVPGQSWTYYLKGGAAFEQDRWTSRGLGDYAGLVANGFLKMGDDAYVILRDAANPDHQYDVEIVVNKALRDALLSGVRVEDGQELRLWYQISNRKPFTYIKPEDFTLRSDNTNVADVAAVESTPGVYNVILTGTLGSSALTLTVGNGAEERAYDLTVGTVKAKAGKTPFLTIPAYSALRTTLTGADTDVLFSSNLTAANAADGNASTAFTATLYAAQTAAEGYEKTGEALWSHPLNSTLDNTITHIAVPGSWLTGPGVYALEITAAYADENKTFTGTAYIEVKNGPAKVTLRKLDSYSVTSTALPTIGYTVTPDNATVEYTVQKSGSEVGERKPASGGAITISADKPTGLRDSYTVTVYARNENSDPWSVDSLVLNVYNEDALEIIMADVTAGDIGGTTSGTGEDISDTTVALDNHDKVNTYLNDSDYVLTFQDFETLRTDMSLQKVISANYGEHAWGMLSDRLSWGSSDGSTVSVDYKQGGIYSDIRNYSYTSYVPSTDFLLVGKGATGDDPVTITATHAATGVTKQFTVTAATLENQLYVFQFAPQTTTHVVYTNGEGQRRNLTSNEKGELAVYEPSGIASTVMALSGSGTETYAGTLYADSLVSGERDIASLQLYPCNNLRLRRISAVELTFLNPDGSRYSGNVTLRAGVYKNGVYCPSAQVRTVNGVEVNKDGRQDVIATVTDGKLSLGFDASQFKHTAEDYGLTQLDTVSYVMEYRVEGNRTGYVRLNAFSDMAGAARATDSLVQLRAVEGLPTTPQITGLHLQQYHEDVPNEYVPNEYVRDVMDYTEDIGISMKFSKAELITEAALTGETVTTDDNGYTTYIPEKSVDFALYTASGKRLSAQTHNTAAQAEQIVDLADLDKATLFVFPFSSTPMARGVYTMTDEVMAADGLSDLGETYHARVKMLFTRDDLTIRSETMPFGVSNLSHRKDISQEDGGAKEIGSEVRGDMMQQVDIGAIFGNVDVNDMLKKGFAFLTGLGGSAENPFLNMMIMPTEDPATFHIMVFVGDGRDSNANADGLSVNYNPDDLYDDWSKFEEEMEKLDDDDDSKMKDDDDDDDDDDDGGEGKISFSFHGALHLVAKCDVVNNDWDISFRGGQVGAGMKATYEWSQNLMCGPVPVLLSLELGFDVDLDLSFANKDAVRAMLLDAALELSVKAFAGVGFDLSLIAFKLGVEGTITAGLDFLYLTQGNKTGTELGINGKIALIMETKIALISYSTTFASTGFGWTKQYGQYNAIRETWANQGFADITGLTASGRRYAMRLMADGTAMVSIAGEGEMENRDYLLTGQRRWDGGTARRGLLRAAPVASFNDVQTNAYPYANPVFTDDGSMFLYISDNDNARNLQSVVRYATRNGSGGYDDAGAVDTEAGAIPADSDVTVSGSGSSVFAAWTKQMESPNKEMHDKVNLDDLGIMLNATEIYTGRYDGTTWTVERLTDNQVADLAPTVSSTGDKAIVAWRSLSASSLSGSEAREDIAAAFNAENNINYRIYNGTGWTDAQIAYNGAAGTVNALDSAMLPDGTAILTYTVRTGGDAESCETFFTIIGADGNVVTTCRLTRDNTADSNAQAVAVGDAFVLGWYAEDSTGNSSSADGAVSSGHDIRLSRITANGSLDADFPETLGAPTASGSFRFSAPATCTDVTQLSVVWPELLDSQEYDVNAVRFYEDNGAIGVSSPITIAHTGQYYAVDAIDTYTDADGKVYVLALGSDYSADNGSYYDSITSDQIQFVNGEGQSAQSLALTAKQPEASIKLGSAAFPANRIEVEAETNLKELTPGVNLPVRFYVTNTGLAPVTTVKLTLGGESKTVDGLHILPGATLPLTMSYPVPTEKVEDVAYTVTANNAATAGGKLVLNHPDVGIGTMKLLREGDGTRDVQVNLTNIAGIPLAGSGKTVKLAFYKDGNCQQSVSETITIPASAYADIDAGIYTYLHTLSVRDFIGEAAEIPESGITVVAKAWVEDPDSAEKYQELYPYDNVASLDFDGLLTKYDTLYSADTAIAENGDETYDVSVKIRNNSLQETDLGTVTADILDSQNKVLASVPLSDSPLKLSTEQTRALSLTSVKLTTPGKPASVQLRSTAATVTLDVSVNGGECTEAYVQLTADGKLPDTLPVATNRINTFLGWYTAAEGGEKVNPGDKVAPGTTLYAQYDYKVGNNVVMSDYQYAKTPATPAMDKATASGITVTYYWTDQEGGFAYNDAVDAGKAWSDGAPVYPGTYYIRAKVSGQGFDPFNTNQTAFHVTDRDPKYEITVEANSGTFTYDNTMKHVTGFKTLTFTFDNVTYTVSGLEAVATGTDAGEYTSTVTGTAVVKDSAGKDLTAQFNVTRVDGKLTVTKADPTAATPTDLTATYGQTLSDVTITNPNGNTPGTWAWVEDGTTAVGNAGQRIHKATFTPEDTGNYNTVADVELTVKVNKADPIAAAPTDLTATYGQTLADVALTNPEGNTPGTWSWAENTATAVGSAGDRFHQAIFTPEDTENYNVVSGVQLTVKVEKAGIDPAVSISDWTYGEAASEPVLNGNTDNATVTYTYAAKGSDDFKTATPTDAGEYTVKATVDATENYNGATLTADFTIAKAGITPQVTLDGWTYGEAAGEPLLTGNSGNAAVAYTYAAKGSDAFGTDTPTAAGEYTVKATVDATANYNGGEATADFTIARADLAIADFTYATPTDLTYDGSAKAAIVATGTDINGAGTVIVKYYSDAACQNEVEPIDAGTYYVAVTVADGANYNAAKLHDDAWTFTIEKATPDAAEHFTYATPTDLTYDGTAKSAAVTVKDGVNGMGDVTVNYYSDAQRTTPATPTDAGTYYVGITVAQGKNYNATDTDLHDVSWQFTIAKADIHPTLSMKNWTEGSRASEPVLEGNPGAGDVTFTYARQGKDDFTDKKPTSAGRYIVKATVAETANYNGGEVTAQFTIHADESGKLTVTSPLTTVTRVTLNGRVVSPANYIVVGGSVQFTEAFLATLKPGTYTIKVTDGARTATATYRIAANGVAESTVLSASTGDAGVVLYAALAVSSLLGFAWVGKKRKEEE